MLISPYYFFSLQLYSIFPGDPGISVSTPTITTPSKVVTIQEKHTTSLSCEAEGLPLPDVTWVRLYGSLPGGRHVIHNNGTLIISGILQQDAGMYVCQAKNVLGMAKSTNLLIVHGMSDAFVLVLHSLPSSINKKLYFHLENYLRQTAPQLRKWCFIRASIGKVALALGFYLQS